MPLELETTEKGLCECGCGQQTPIARKTYRWRGVIKGNPQRFMPGHQNKLSLETTFRKRFVEGDPDECWEWQGSINENGYGRLNYHGQNSLAHRLSYRLFCGPIARGLEVCHKCDNPPCVNPKHLFAGTHADNVRDMYAKGRGGYRGLKGEAHHEAKLNDEKVRAIRHRLAEGEKRRVIAEEFGVSYSAIWLISIGKRWSHIP